MPDITMCPGGDCPVKKACYRYMAEPDPHYQSYANYHENATSSGCEHFWMMWGEKKRERINKILDEMIEVLSASIKTRR